MKRDVGVELHRCLMMLGIVALHTCQCAGRGCSPFCRWIEFCVDGFVFISGWYGIKFDWRKVARVYALALLYSAFYIFILTGSGDATDVVKAAGWYWFINAYVMLMCIAPIVNEGLEMLRGECARRVLPVVLPLFVAVFGWSFLSVVPGVGAWVPYVAGFGSHTFLTLLGVYVVARLLRFYDFGQKLKTRYLLIALGLLSMLAFLNLNKYNSPVAVSMGACTFFFDEKDKHGRWPPR